MSTADRSSLSKFPFPTPPRTQKTIFSPIVTSESHPQRNVNSSEMTLYRPTSQIVLAPPSQNAEPRGIKVRRPLTAKKIDQFTCYNCCHIYPMLRLHPYSKTMNRMICTNCVTSHKLFLLANLEPFTRNLSEEFVRCHQKK
jgi:formylmethanofuran dehydrogenase subunit E